MGTEVTQRVKAVLRDNNYPMSCIQNCERMLAKQPAENPPQRARRF